MTNDCTIRAASRDDAADLVALLEQLGYSTTPAGVIERLGRLEQTGLDQVFVALEANRVVAVASLHITPALLHRDGPTARITTLVVDEHRRMRDMGRRLVATLEELARSIGCTLIEAGCSKEYTGAQGFYEAIGYARSHELLRKTLESDS